MKCQLCLTNPDLVESHIIPKFVGKWLKETSATGYLRQAASPNLRKQDLPTEPLLCKNCEQLLSEWERCFAEEVFHPYHTSSKRTFKYKIWLLKFAVSLHWRACISDIEDFREFKPHLVHHLERALSDWRTFLLGQSSLGKYDHHLFFLDEVESSQGALPEGFHWYTLRGVDATIPANDKQVFSYVKLPGFVFFSGVYPTRLEGWERTKIHQNGQIKAKNQRVTHPLFGEFLLHRAKLAMVDSPQISDRQEKKIVESMLKDPERTLKSHSLRIQQIEQYWKQQQDSEERH